MVLNVISLQYSRLTALVHCCWSGHSHWDVKVTDVAPKSPLINIYAILRARWYKSASFYLLETKVEKNWLQTLIIMCFWHLIDRRQNNENADEYLSLYHWLRLFSATDFDDILVWSVLKLTLYEPNYKEKEVHWPTR